VERGKKEGIFYVVHKKTCYVNNAKVFAATHHPITRMDACGVPEALWGRFPQGCPQHISTLTQRAQLNNSKERGPSSKPDI